MEINVDGTNYRIQFEHTHKATKKGRKTLGPLALKGVTQCIIVTDKLVIPTVAFCTVQDNFARENGRRESLGRGLEHPLIPREHAVAIQLAYDTRPRGRNNVKEVEKHG